MKHTLYFLVLLFIVSPLEAGDSWQDEADARIERHRKEDVKIIVTKNGKPVQNATVKVTMERHEFLFGCNIFKWSRFEEPEADEAYKRRFAELFNFATLGFYWWSYEQKMDQPNYDYSEQVVQWCKQNKITTKGHPLSWNHADPSWVKKLDDEEIYRRQIDRIKQCAEHFRGKIEIWDVFNEPVAWNRKGFWERSPRLTRIIKQKDPLTFVKACFVAARKGNPEATLLINDFLLDERYVEWIEKLVDENGKPLYDVIGLQSHMHGAVWNNDKIWKTCERYKKFGVPLHFTETTIISALGEFDKDRPGGTPTTPEGEIQQRDDIVRFYTMLFSHPSVEAITWWGLTDRGAWRNAPAGFLRKDMSPKSSFDALKHLIREKWATNESGRTDADGVWKVRAFRGDYRLDVTLPDGTEVKDPYFREVKKQSPEIVIELP